MPEAPPLPKLATWERGPGVRGSEIVVVPVPSPATERRELPSLLPLSHSRGEGSWEEGMRLWLVV